MSRQRGRPWSSVRRTLLSVPALPGLDLKLQLESKKRHIEAHMKKTGSHKMCVYSGVCGRGCNMSKVHFQSICLYNETLSPAYQSQPYFRELCCVAPQRPAQWFCFFAGRCSANLSIWHDACLVRKTETPSVNTNKTSQHRCGIHWCPGETTPSYV